jgi:hypothetical protein
VRALIGCECSGIIRQEFRRLGHEAWSCDLKPAEDGSPHHIQDDVLRVMRSTMGGRGWDLFIVHPECTYVSGSGLHWYHRRAGRPELVEEAVAFALEVWSAPIPFVCMENPIGYLSRRIRKPDQIIQPYEFGDDASKATCLWLSGLPLLKLDPAQRVAGRLVSYRGKPVERWANQTDSGQNRLTPSPSRATDRARTYPGIARAKAEQWGPYVAARLAA